MIYTRKDRDSEFWGIPVYDAAFTDETDSSGMEDPDVEPLVPTTDYLNCQL